METLRRYRERNGYSFQKMADLVGISKAFYWQIEHNQRRMTYELSMRIAKVFDLKPDDLFYEDMKDHEYVANNERNKIKG